MKYDSLHKAVIGVLQEKKALHPNQQKLDVHEPEKDELTSKDFEMLRAGKKAKVKEDIEQVEHDEQVEETLEFHDAFTYEVKESYTFGDYLSTAKKLVGEDEAINLANKAFRDQDTSIFVEEYSQAAVEDKVKAHMNAGHKVSMPKYSTRDGKPRAEYVVTDKESGVRRKYIHQGNVTKMENMGARGKKDEK